jgi:hypothetical protein
MQNIYPENCKALLKQIKEVQNKFRNMGKTYHGHGLEVNAPQIHVQIKANLSQNSS